MMLLNSFMSWCQSNTIGITSTGDTIKSDTIVNVPISAIRKANVLMIERNYLLDITEEQDSIICLHKLYIEEQDSIIELFKDRVEQNNKINENINKAYEKERRKTIIFGTTTGVLSAIVVTTILINSLK